MLQKRALTVNFQRAVTGDGPPVVMEVAVNPLSVPNAPSQDATLITRETQDVLIADNAQVVFQLVPTDHPDLTERVTYRIAWREKYMGRMFSQDFVMPDFDVDYDDLQDLGNIIGGTTYLQWSDRGAPSGVAGLNPAGQVIDADGNVVGGSGDAAAVQGNLDNEIVARQQGDNFLRQYFLSFASDQIAQVYLSTAQNLNVAVAQLENADTIEKAARITGDTTLDGKINTLAGITNDITDGINNSIDNINDLLVLKADLVGGKIITSQLPDVALGRAVTVANEAAMLALTSTQVQPGDFAVRPDGIWFLNASPASVLNNWVRFQISAVVQSVNGQTGTIVLGPTDVGARSSSVAVPQADVSGLVAALAAKTDVTTTTAINARLVTVEGDASIVRLVSGTIPRTAMGTFLAYINTDGQITRKDGTVINVGGGGGDLDIEDVTGLIAALASKVDTSDARMTNARTPSEHAASHATGGSDPVTPAAIGARAEGVDIAQADITGLSTALSGHGTRLSSLENRVEDLEAGGGGGGGGTGGTAKTTWWSGTAPVSEVDFDTDVSLRSPFGFNGANYYYDPAGAVTEEAVWPYLTPNGHLKFIARDEDAPADAEFVLESDFDDLAALVSAKASQSALDATNAAVATKASQTDLTALTATVAAKAAQTDLTTLSTTVSGKAAQSALDALSATVSGKASQTALDSLTTTVGTKADLVSGSVPLGQLPNNIPASKIPDLTALLAAKVDTTTLSSYTTTSGLTTLLAGKADLDVNGKVPTSQIPALALNTVVTVSSRSAMLALNTTQVQPGDIAIITATADKGSYILTTTDPSTFGNWTKITAPDDVVQSVNGQVGTVVLGASDVGARSSSAAIPQADITGLVTALGSKADASAVTTALAGKTSPSDVQGIIVQSSPNKQKADYASATSVASLSGQQSVDGILVPLGSVVLLTAQPSSVNNGLWTVNTGSWTRVADMATGDFFIKGTQAIVASGNSNANTIWLQTATAGVTGTNANNWVKVLTAGAPPTYTASLGVDKIGNDFRAKVVTGGGILAVSGGLQLDPNVASRKFAGDVPSGSTIATITHNLNSTDVQASFRDKTSGDAVLVGWKPTGVNTISVEFDTAPATGQWRCVCVG